MGGCLLTDYLSWASTMFAYNSCPRTRRWWASAGGRCGTSGWRQRAVAGRVAAPPAPGRLLAARLDLRGLLRHPVPGAGRQRLGRRLHQRRVPAARRARRPTQGARRSVVAQVPPPRAAGPGRRLPAGARPVVGPVVVRRPERRDGRADAADLDAGERPAVDGLRGAAGPLGRGAELALPAGAPRRAPPRRPPRPSAGYRPGHGRPRAAHRAVAAVGGPVRGQVVFLQRPAGPAVRPARGGRRLPGLRRRGPHRTDRDPRYPGGGP